MADEGRDSDVAAGFEQFVATRAPALARTAYLLTGDHHRAEDLLQTTLVKVARHWERIESNPEAYARRALYHENISWWRRRRFAERSLEAYDDRAATSPKERAGSLPRRCRGPAARLAVGDSAAGVRPP